MILKNLKQAIFSVLMLARRMIPFVPNPLADLQQHFVGKFAMLGRDCPVTDKAGRRTIYQAMSNAVPAESRSDGGAEGLPPFVREGQPWITFVSLRHRRGCDEDVESLIAEMINREELKK